MFDDHLRAQEVAAQLRQRVELGRGQLHLLVLEQPAHEFGTRVGHLGAVGRLARRQPSMLGMARNEARISTGWCVGPFLPIPMESWLKTNFTGRPISAAMRMAGRS